MSAIKDSGYIITLKGKEYRLLFSLNALDEIQTKFGDCTILDQVFRQDNPNWVKETRWLLTLLINEGLLDEDENAKLLSEQQVGRMIHMGNLKMVQQSIFKSFASGIKGDETEEETENNEEGEAKAAQES